MADGYVASMSQTDAKDTSMHTRRTVHDPNDNFFFALPKSNHEARELMLLLVAASGTRGDMSISTFFWVVFPPHICPYQRWRTGEPKSWLPRISMSSNTNLHLHHGLETLILCSTLNSLMVVAKGCQVI